MDNLNIKGIRDEEPPARRGKKARDRKRFVLESRFMPGPKCRPGPGLGWLFRGLQKWYTHSRYHTASARDQAYAALVKKSGKDRMRHWTRQEFRKV